LKNQEDTNAWVKVFVGDSEDPTEPLTAIYYPILEEADVSVSIAGANNRSTKLVGVLAL
jgi:hypothetical protein